MLAVLATWGLQAVLKTVFWHLISMFKQGDWLLALTFLDKMGLKYSCPLVGTEHVLLANHLHCLLYQGLKGLFQSRLTSVVFRQ